jgi:3-deoxy-D-manno-octulosonic-acid transferase
LLPFIIAYLLFRLIKGKEDKQRFFERLGVSGTSRPKGNIIWFHCASVGEANSVFPLIEEIEEKYKNLNFLITTGTVSSAKTVHRKIESKTNLIHQYIPVDSYICVKLFLLKWRPKLAIYVESELWPNLIRSTANSGCDVILVNAKISDNSFRKWQKFEKIISTIASSVSSVIAQTESDKHKFEKLGFQNVTLLDSLKYAANKLPNNASELGKLVLQIGSRKTFLTASTSDNEEEIIIKAHKNLQKEFPNLLTLIAPRHPERVNEISDICKRNNLRFSIRSRNQNVHENTQIYICDTLGELGILYRACGVIFIGGSLNERGGQNPIEPANLNCTIISGNKVKNFKSIYNEFKNRNAVKIVSDQEELEKELSILLVDRNKRKEISNNAKELVESKKYVIEKYLEAINPYIKPLVI